MTLSARLWARDPRRIVIYLHEYGDEQTAWWATADRGGPADPSALTFDFRGHGASGGDHDDVAGTPADARAALEYAIGQGYAQIILVGAGMGAAVAIEVAADTPPGAMNGAMNGVMGGVVGVVGLSTPAEFADLRPIDRVQRLGTRIALISARDDLSARDSLAQFRARAAIPEERIVTLDGSDHGGELLTGTHAEAADAALRRLTGDLWRP